MEPDFTVTELGNFDSAGAERVFRTHNWPYRLGQAEDARSEPGSFASPDLTFTASPAHMVVTGESPDRFTIEVSLPPAKKALGIFGFTRFYDFQGQNVDSVSRAIRAFCGENLEAKHSFFRAMQVQQP